MVVDTVLYDLLGIPSDAAAADIRKAYHRRSLACHPDKQPPERREAASQEFQRVNEAFEILNDAQQRAAYDQLGYEGMHGRGAGTDDVGMDDLFASMFGATAGQGAGPSRRAAPMRRRAPPTVLNYGVSLSDLYLGCEAHFHLQRDIFCQPCQGKGTRPGCSAHTCVECRGSGRQTKLASMGQGYMRNIFVDCQACHGEGERIRERDRCKRCKGAKLVRNRARLDVNIEAGMRDGQRLVFREQGDCKVGCRLPGHLILTLKLRPHDTIEVRNNDLLVQASITLGESLAGLHRSVFTHLDGRSIRTQSPRGMVIRPGDCCIIPGEGMPGRSGARTGDLYVRWTIEFPPDNWLSQIDALKLASLLPARKTDPAEGFAVVTGKVGRATDQDDQAGASEPDAHHAETTASEHKALRGLGSVQEAILQPVKLEQFGSDPLPPLEEPEADSDEEETDGASCTIC